MELNNRPLQARGDPTSISLTVRSCTEGTGLCINSVHVTLIFTPCIVQVLLWSFLDSTQAPENQLLCYNKLVKPVVNTGVHKGINNFMRLLILSIKSSQSGITLESSLQSNVLLWGRCLVSGRRIEINKHQCSCYAKSPPHLLSLCSRMCILNMASLQ